MFTVTFGKFGEPGKFVGGPKIWAMALGRGDTYPTRAAIATAAMTICLCATTALFIDSNMARSSCCYAIKGLLIKVRYSICIQKGRATKSLNIYCRRRLVHTRNRD